MQTIAPPAARHQASRKLVDDLDVAVLDHVVNVALEQRVGLQALIDVVEDVHVGRIVEVFNRQQAFSALNAFFGERRGPVLLIDLEIDVPSQARYDLVDPVILVGRLIARARNDQWRPRFIDQDRVHLINDREVVPSLDQLGHVELHVVAQVVEAEFVVRPVGDVGCVGRSTYFFLDPVLDHTDFEPEEMVDLAHPFRIAVGEIVVDRYDMDALAAKSVEIGRKRGDQGFTFPCLHLSDPTGVERVAADQLYVVVTHAQYALGRFTSDGEGLGKQVFQRGALIEFFPKFWSLGLELSVGETRQGGFQCVDRHNDRLDLS